MFSAATNSSTSFGSLFLLLLLIGATCITAISLPANGDAATQIQGRASNSSSSSDSGSGSDTDDKRMSKVHINFLDPNIKWQRPYDGSGNYNDTVTSETIDKGWWATFGLGASIGFNLITYYEDPHEIKQNISCKSTSILYSADDLVTYNLTSAQTGTERFRVSSNNTDIASLRCVDQLDESKVLFDSNGTRSDTA